MTMDLQINLNLKWKIKNIKNFVCNIFSIAQKVIFQTLFHELLSIYIWFTYTICFLKLQASRGDSSRRGDAIRLPPRPHPWRRGHGRKRQAPGRPHADFRRRVRRRRGQRLLVYLPWCQRWLPRAGVELSGLQAHHPQRAQGEKGVRMIFNSRWRPPSTWAPGAEAQAVLDGRPPRQVR